MSAQVQIELPLLAVNGQRLWGSLTATARIGATAKGGVCRSALTDLDRDGRDLFVPCVDGISHNEVEDAKPEWITAGANVLLHAMLGRSGR